MKSDTKSVLILNKFTSPEIQQAIVILKNPDTSRRTEIVAEAERVIDEYLQHRRYTALKPDPVGKGIFMAVIGLGMVITALAVYGGVHLLTEVFM